MQKISLVLEWLGRNAASLGFERKPSLSFVYFVFDCFSHHLFLVLSLPSLHRSLSQPPFHLPSLSHCQLSLSVMRFMFWEFDEELWAQMSLKGMSLLWVSCSVWWECCSNTDSCHVSYVCHWVQCVTVPVPSDPHPPQLDMFEDGHVVMHEPTWLRSSACPSKVFFLSFKIF